MQIDWFTLVAQIVNFLILLWLLQRFLYKPIVNAMERREQKIADHLREAEAKQQEAEEEADKYRSMQRELDDRRDEMMQAARQDADARRQKLMDEMRAEADEARRNWRLAVQQEKEAFLNELEERLGESAIDVARHVLADMADAKLETQVVRVFVRQLDNAEDDAREQIAQAVQSETVRVDSAFELAQDDRTQIEEGLRDLSPDLSDAELTLDYNVVRDMLCGLRLTTGEYELSWAFADYTSAVRAQFSRAIEDGLDESVLDAATAESDTGPDETKPAADEDAQAGAELQPAGEDLEDVEAEKPDDGEEGDGAAESHDREPHDREPHDRESHDQKRG